MRPDAGEDTSTVAVIMVIGIAGITDVASVALIAVADWHARRIDAGAVERAGVGGDAGHILDAGAIVVIMVAT